MQDATIHDDYNRCCQIDDILKVHFRFIIINADKNLG